ncbi:MAG: bifunctional hydroxymethylpyrimidine kinase/phosphomethylpyrimidine kinase, partial [Chloroflexota bacterium]
FGTSVITAITAQNTYEVRDAYHLPPEMVAAQIHAVVDDIAPRAAKTGMLANADIVKVVADTLRGMPEMPVVVDPVAFTSTGFQLLEADALTILRRDLIPLAVLVTPNLREATAQTGVEIASDDDMRQAAEAMLGQGARAVLIKGGHLSETADDLYMDGNCEHWFRSPRVDTEHNHGTGCSLSAGIAAGLARELPLLQAIEQAKTFVTEGLRHGYVVGKGRSPINHFYRLQREIEGIYA